MKIPQDKILHFLVGTTVAAVFYPVSPVAAIVVTIALAVGKELRDSVGYGTVDAYDALTTILGGLSLLTWYEAVSKIL
jgi:hypothetical protein